LGSVHRKEKQIVLVADHNSAESAALQVRALPVYEKPPARWMVIEKKKQEIDDQIDDQKQ